MIVTLLTDFGTSDHYVGVMKGVVLGADSGAVVVDLSHEIGPGDIPAAAYLMLVAYRHFPAGTVHVVVVDPGVGSDRRVIVAAAAGQFFVGPDNGVFSYLLDREPEARIYHVADDRFFRRPVSHTFHGRDVFAPLAAALACGAEPDSLGPPVSDAIRLPPIGVRRTGSGALVGRILHVDRFGNCITSIARHDVVGEPAGFRLSVGATEVGTLREHYAGAPAGQAFAIWGSSGFLEVSVNGESAAELLKLRRGAEVVLHHAGDSAAAADTAHREGDE